MLNLSLARAPARLLCLALAVLAVPALTPAPQQQRSAGPIVTLRAQDAFTSALNLATLKHTGHIQDGELILDDAGLAFGVYEPGKLSFGFRRDEAALLVDLGPLKVPGVTTTSDIAPRPDVSAYNTLRLADAKVIYNKPVNKIMRSTEGQMIFGNYPVEGAQHITPVAGHVYLLRNRDPKAKGAGERIVKFLVLEADVQRVALRITMFKAM